MLFVLLKGNMNTDSKGILVMFDQDTWLKITHVQLIIDEDNLKSIFFNEMNKRLSGYFFILM